MDKGSQSSKEANATLETSSQKNNLVAAPIVSLPKGGGAIHGMGEKFAANPVTGTGSMSIPIATSPGRSGFGPQLTLSYDSGAGNGTFGFGWNLSLPSITRKTDKGLPKYHDTEDSDVFILSGAEDLVPILIKQNGLSRTVGNNKYSIKSYRPRIEGLFARIERWSNLFDPADTFWRSISKDNITTWYGKTSESRIFDPTDSTRIFSWLICQSYDDKGNVIVYGYENENSDNVDETQVHERNRSEKIRNQNDEIIDPRSANRYLKRILYGNHIPYLPKLTETTAWPSPPGVNASDTDTSGIDGSKDWYFEVVFDYGDHEKDKPLPRETAKKWEVRNDPFSTYRAGFEVRTYRLCQRVLMFHHFPGEPGIEANCLVRSTDFNYSKEYDPKNAKKPIYSFLESAKHTSYKRKDESSYFSKSLPPLEFQYTQPIIDEIVHEVDPESLENLPSGLDGSNYQFVDLDGEGLSGILSEQGTGWFYKRNHSANNLINDPVTNLERSIANFSSVELVASKPNTLLTGGRAQFMDLAGDGQTDLVEMEAPVRGFYERTIDEGWKPFQAFTSWPNIDTRDPNLKFIDLTGDGHADILISEDQAFIWHGSLAEAGYGTAQRVQKQFDEEKGPRIVFSDSEQSFFLADLSGDGLTDLVRIRNGEVCYWPNLGYCRFGAKVTMDNSPWFDNCDQFNPHRIRLADIDGSGTTDILYLHSKGVHIYFNQSGNSWRLHPEVLEFPTIENLASIQAMDLLGNGTACLVWSSPLANYARCPMRYIDLMGGQKPHLLVKSNNNLGAETTVQYAPSTKFYLQDKEEGKPWITKLPFPVHVVEKVTVTDKWRQTSFSSTYSYHHGYFDGIEREFRGFGRVEQVDVESYGKFENGNPNSLYITDDKTLYQPPVKTITWYHTGAFLDRERIINHFGQEYFPKWIEEKYLNNTKLPFQEIELPQPDLNAENLNADEWREALRACKGMMLRQEVYELDIDALEQQKNPEQLPVKLFSTAYHNCHIRLLQPKATNQHAVFLVAESEAITYHYELDIRKSILDNLSLDKNTLIPDPRIAHTLNVNYDEYGNVLQSVAAVYRRIEQFKDTSLAKNDLDLIHAVQQERHLAYTEIHYTEDFGSQPADHIAALDNHRLRLPCEVMTYELTGLKQKSAPYFTLEDIREYRLSLVHQPDPQNLLDTVSEIPYQQIARTTPQKRLVEHTRTLFFQEDLVNPLPLAQHGRLGLTFENYKLALTDSLLDAVFTDTAGNNKLDQTIDGVSTTARAKLNDPAISGYLSGAKLIERFEPPIISATELTGQYWIRSGIAGFAPDAVKHFYLPERYTDPFDNITMLEYDPRDLFVVSSTDMLKNKTEVIHFDFRVLAPREMKDINGNLSEVYFDVLGLPTAMAVKGKGTEGDSLTGFNEAIANPELPKLTAFFVEKPYDESQARKWLRDATARHVYYFGEIEEKQQNGTSIILWEQHPACACGIVREQHVVDNPKSPIQSTFEYSDGMGSVIVKKVQAEPEKPGKPLRWVGNGRTILNNKGKPVKQYEPDFSAPDIGHHYEEPPETGVTSVIYYDAPGRVVRTEMPDGSYSRVEFSPWHVLTFDQNDTVKEPGNLWFLLMNAGTPEQQRAAQLAVGHADTPSLTILDSLGRDVISIAHNRFVDVKGDLKDEKYVTFTKLDAEGKPLWIRDARGNLVMQYITPNKPTQASDEPDQSQPERVPTTSVPCYDIAGNLLYQHSMDAGDRWLINDAAGKPMFAWDSRGHTFRTDYDKLHRPTGSFVKGADKLDPNRIIQFEKIIYGDTPNNGLRVDLVNPENDQTKQLNLCGKPYIHSDTAGVVTVENYDFKGNPLSSQRQFAIDYKTTPDWSKTPALQVEKFSTQTNYDALNRPVAIITPDKSVYRPSFNEANLLDKIDVKLPGAARATPFVTNIDYNAKGQRMLIVYANGATTTYGYDANTFRLINLKTTRPDKADATASILFNDITVVQDLYYTYDPVGNITHIADKAHQKIYCNNQMVEAVSDYAYDALYRLIAATGRERKGAPQFDWNDSDNTLIMPPESLSSVGCYVEAYAYDPVGNIMDMIHHFGSNINSPGTVSWHRRYNYAETNNQLLATSIPGDSNNTFSDKYGYDPHGNMANMPHLPLMQWDFKDQLCASSQQLVKNGRTPETTYYVYDAGGQRVRKVTEKKDGTRHKERIYLGGYEVYREYSRGAVALERQTLHVMDDKQRIALVETKTIDNKLPIQKAQPLTRYQLGNHLGSVSLELDGKAGVICYEEYTPYGSTAFCAGRSAAEVSLKRYRYTGKERDEEMGFSYHGARYYAPWLGRWVSCDPVGVKSGVNVYVYTRSNPINFIDPNGTEEKSINSASLTKEQITNIMGQSKDLNDLKLRLGLGIVTDEKLSAYLSVKGFNAPESKAQPSYSGPSVGKPKAGGIPLAEIERRQAVILGNIHKISNDPLATVLSAGTILRGGDPDELSTQLDRAKPVAGALSAIAGVKIGKDGFEVANQSVARKPSLEPVERQAQIKSTQSVEPKPHIPVGYPKNPRNLPIDPKTGEPLFHAWKGGLLRKTLKPGETYDGINQNLRRRFQSWAERQGTIDGPATTSENTVVGHVEGNAHVLRPKGTEAQVAPQSVAGNQSFIQYEKQEAALRRAWNAANPNAPQLPVRPLGQRRN